MTNDVLFVHNNFPGQFGFIAEALKQRGARCAAIGSVSAKDIGIPVQRWRLKRGTTPGVFRPAVRAEADLLRARAAADCAIQLRRKGFDPRLIIGHPGWGETLFLKEVFPQARTIAHGEYFYHAHGADVGFDPEFQNRDLEERFRILAKNMGLALAYAEANAIVCPTSFQASLFPPALRPSIRQIHEGVDTDAIAPDPGARFTLPDGRVLDGSTPVITFISRHMEPLRGFHIFMRALPAILAAVPEAEIILIGDDSGKGYGGAATGAASWRERFLPEVQDRLDMARVHFMGRTPHPQMLAALSLSWAHVYYTYPFVLSWSLLEAMASECLIVASDTAPVRDVVVDGENGRLLDFFDVDALAETVIDACRRPGDFQPMRKAARRTVVERFDRQRVCLPAWLALIREVLGQA